MRRMCLPAGSVTFCFTSAKSSKLSPVTENSPTDLPSMERVNVPSPFVAAEAIAV